MTARPNILSFAALVSLLIFMLVPISARSQDPAEPTVAPEAGATEPAAQKSGSLVIPEQGKDKEKKTETGAQPAETAAEEPANAKATVAEEDKIYIIRQGDTLWDISSALMKDPFLWPFIWKANPYIANPDLIYPGNKLTIPSLFPIEQALQAPVERTKEVVREPVEERPRTEGIAGAGVVRPKAAEEPAEQGSRLVLPEEQPLPVFDKYAMLSAGFVNQDETDDRILRAREEPKSVLSYDDIVYVRIHNPEQVNVGDKFLIYTPLNTVKHPKTGKRFGRLIKVLGILQITDKEKPKALTARITLSFDAIEKSNLLVPYQEPALLYPSGEKRAKDITGYIIEVTDRRSINAQVDVVYLDKGSSDGVAAGDRFNVYADDDPDYPRKKIGEIQVILVKEHTSTAIVRTSTDTMAKGDSVDFNR
ncbi:MAG TPA: LysM peptidoglycan-binding domain-containing protein [Nitrospirota bacterium]